ncbi:uncharacterized protein MKK02DRAFT_34014 [Dioszegia hungarica]|uniref:Class E vacuolar protein-sorting machinery protein HSE1 n=1 Tax=Dioszegia hungarica TaxID=4972 RepID=A0AA38HBH0_9TREE|nr:uncharacterized protein MKK02DRAFT_34014 [Dioszegia hungarica]KAI9636935.1 hypothetical protein MKK02DRAFT_34014 [Dioszegia hungarica]
MFSSTNPYDEIVADHPLVKATDENLASEDWALNLEVCDKVSSEGATGARNAVASLQKRLSHRNPNVQLYALEVSCLGREDVGLRSHGLAEIRMRSWLLGLTGQTALSTSTANPSQLANTLAQNTGKPLMEELSSRNWTSSLDRLVNDRATNAAVKKKALGYIKAWAKQFEDTKEPNLTLMSELYDQLRAKNFSFGDAEPVPEDAADARRRQEEEELARVLELSKQDKGGRNTTSQSTYQPSGSSSSAAAASRTQQPAPAAQSSYQPYQSSYANNTQAGAAPARASEPEPAPLDVNTATRVRALYAFSSVEVGELNFERGDVIKVLDRGFKEWWRGACNGRIGIFPVTYVEALAEPTARELQDEAQEEARVFASLGLVDQLLQTLKSIDPARGDRLDDRPEVEQMYQASVGLQGQINALIKKYSDQKAELEHMNANFLRAMKQYEELRSPPQQSYFPPPQPAHDPYAQAQHPGYPQQPQPQQHPSQPIYSPQHAPQQQVHPAQYAPQPTQQAFPAPHPSVSVTNLHAQAPAASPDAYYAPQPGQHAPEYPQQPQGQAQTQRIPSGAPNFPPSEPLRTGTEPGAAGMGAGAEGDAAHKAAWDAYYRQQAEAQAQAQAQGQGQAPRQGSGPSPPRHQGSDPNAGQQPHQPSQVPYGQSPYPAAPEQQGHPGAPGYQYPTAHPGVDHLSQSVNRMSVHGQ